MVAEEKDRSLIGLRVLYLEDNALIALNCADAMESLGCLVTTCNSLTEAFEAVAREIPDVGLLDVNVHGETCYEVAETLERQGVPVAFLSGCMSSSLVLRWETHPHIEKPCGSEDIRRVIVYLARHGVAKWDNLKK